MDTLLIIQHSITQILTLLPAWGFLNTKIGGRKPPRPLRTASAQIRNSSYKSLTLSAGTSCSLQCGCNNYPDYNHADQFHLWDQIDFLFYYMVCSVSSHYLHQCWDSWNQMVIHILQRNFIKEIIKEITSPFWVSYGEDIVFCRVL